MRLAGLVSRSRGNQSLSIEELQKISRIILVGLSSGKEIVGIFRWMGENEENQKLRDFSTRLAKDIKLENFSKVLLSEKEKSGSPLESFWFEILLQAHKGNQHLTQLLHCFMNLSSRIHQLDRQLRAQLLVPKLQALICCLIGLSFAIILPGFWPELFPSFLSMGRFELFAVGIAGMLAGIYTFQLMQKKPIRRFQELVEFVSFFEFLAALSLSGLDFVSAWRKVVETELLSEETKFRLSLDSHKMESVRELLQKLQQTSKGPWRTVMTGLLWTQSGGVGLSKYLRSVLDFSVMDLCMQWEEEIRSIGVLAIIPLCLFIFPSSMFLLIGPRLLEMAQL